MGERFPSLPPLHRPSIPQPSRSSIKPLTLIITLVLVLCLLGSIVLSYASMESGDMQTGGTLRPDALARFAVHLLPQAFSTPVPASPPATPSPSPTPTASYPFLDYPLYGGNPQKPEIALTFDDGPHPYNTPQVLVILNRFGIKATFFCVGRLVAAFPELVRQEYAAGHLVEDHSWSHPDLPFLAPSTILTQIAQTSDTIYATIGVRPAFFRPPYGAFDGQVLAQARTLHLTTLLERGFRFVTIGQLVNDLGRPAGKVSH